MEKENPRVKQTRPFGMRDKIGYMMGDLGCNTSFGFLSSYMMLFFVTCMGINEKLYALLIMIAKLWDAINDPIIGAICDMTKPGKHGKFIPWIKWASFPLTVLTVTMFIFVPGAPYWVRVMMCLGSYCLWSVAYTAVNVPYGSLQSVATVDVMERGDLSKWRSIGAAIGQIPVFVIVPLLIYDKQTDQPIGQRFIWIALGLSLFGLIAFQLLTRLSTERLTHTVQERQQFNYAATVKTFFTNRPILALTIASVASLTFVGTVTSTMQYVFIYYFKNARLLSLGTVLAMSPMVICIFIMKPLMRRFSKKDICAWSTLLAILGNVLMLAIPTKSPYVWLAMLAISLFPMALFNMYIWAMIADCIDYQETRTGKREEASVYALYSFFRKLAQGIGASLVSLALGWTGYVALLGENQAPEVGNNLRLLAAILPLIGNVVIFFVMKFMYNIGNKELDEIKRKLGR